jgi:anti-sigma-K factor RskA
MTRLPPEDPDKTLAAEYVLGTLEGDERARFAARAATEPALQQEVWVWERHLASLADEVAPLAPPPALQQKMEARLFGIAPKAGLWQRLEFWRGLSIAALAALVLVIAVPRFISPSPQPTSVAELAAADSPVKLAAIFDPAHGVIRYNRVSGTPAEGRDYELWAIIGTDAPVSLGVVPQGETGVIQVSAQLAARMAVATLAISDEPKGGSPTGKPTGAVLAAGKLTPI